MRTLVATGPSWSLDDATDTLVYVSSPDQRAWFAAPNTSVDSVVVTGTNDWLSMTACTYMTVHDLGQNLTLADLGTNVKIYGSQSDPGLMLNLERCVAGAYTVQNNDYGLTDRQRGDTLVTTKYTGTTIDLVGNPHFSTSHVVPLGL